MTAEELARIALQLAEQGQDLAWVSVVETRGSTPRHSGAQMLVTADGRARGTIGGGPLEASAIQQALEVLKCKQSRVAEFDLSNREAGESGMICGGRVSLLIEYVAAGSPAWLELLHALVVLASERRRGWLVSVLPPAEEPVAGQEGREVKILGRCLVDDRGEVYGEPAVPADILRELARKGGSADQLLAQGPDRIYLQPVGPREVLYIFGAGHCGQSLATVADLVGFATVVVDDRKEFASPERFPRAERLVIPESFDQALADLPIDEESYLVIMTRGHVHDKTVLAQALRTPAAYIGMIGSRKKVAQTFRELEQEGTPAEALARVHAPIGLDIGSETPEEIAVSIVAELIQERARRHRTHT